MSDIEPEDKTLIGTKWKENYEARLADPITVAWAAKRAQHIQKRRSAILTRRQRVAETESKKPVSIFAAQ